MENLVKDGMQELKDIIFHIKKYIEEGECTFPFSLFIIFDKTKYANLFLNL